MVCNRYTFGGDRDGARRIEVSGEHAQVDVGHEHPQHEQAIRVFHPMAHVRIASLAVINTDVLGVTFWKG